MKKVIRLTESDLTRIVKRVINENEDALASEIDKELSMVDNPDPGLLKRIAFKLKNSKLNVQSIIRKLKSDYRKIKDLNKFIS